MGCPETEKGPNEALLESIYNEVISLAAGGVSASMTSAITAVVVDESSFFAVKALDNDGNEVDVSLITPGTYNVYRIRAGVRTTIVSGSASSESAGMVYAEYSFPNASWAVEDIAEVEFNGIIVDGVTYDTQRYICRVAADAPLTTTVDAILDELQDATTGLAAIKTAVNTVDTVVDGIATQTADLAAIKAKTDQLTFTGADVKATLDGETVTPADASITSAKFGAGAINATVVATDTFDSDAVAASAVTKIQAGLATAAAVAALNNISSANVLTQVLAGLNTAISSTPTAKSINDLLNKNSSLTYDKAADSNEAQRDRLDELLGIDVAIDGGAEYNSTAWSAQGSPTSQARSSAQAFQGAYSRTWLNPAGSSSHGIRNANFLTRAGEQYLVDLWIRCDNATTVTVALFDGGSIVVASNQALSANTWTRIRGIVTSTTSTASAFVYIVSTTNGAYNYYVDELKCIRLDGYRGILEKLLERILYTKPSATYPPIAGGLMDGLHKNTSYTFDNTTDSNEAIRDRLDAVLPTSGQPQVRGLITTVTATLTQGYVYTSLLAALTNGYYIVHAIEIMEQAGWTDAAERDYDFYVQMLAADATNYYTDDSNAEMSALHVADTTELHGRMYAKGSGIACKAMRLVSLGASVNIPTNGISARVFYEQYGS